MRLTLKEAEKLLPRLSARDRAVLEEVKQQSRERGGSKYGNELVKTSEGLFHSAGEYERWCSLKIERRAGLVQKLRRQVPYEVHVRGVHVFTYYADFVYLRSGREVVEDFKGYSTEIYLLKKKIIEALYGFRILETRRARKR